MSRVLIVEREGGRGFAVLIALLATIVLFHDTLARALGGPAERLRLFLGKTSAWDLGACLCGAAQEVTVVRDDGLKLAASVYTEDAAERRPAIVLLHGNTGQAAASIQGLGEPPGGTRLCGVDFGPRGFRRVGGPV
jgi:hypothetical protein